MILPLSLDESSPKYPRRGTRFPSPEPALSLKNNDLRQKYGLICWPSVEEKFYTPFEMPIVTD
jgi:hypothetical protein